MSVPHDDPIIFSEFDQNMMIRAVDLAKKALGRTTPNPLVGCVVAKNHKVIGEGFHEKAGQAHAEVVALGSCQEATAGATLYVNLEPCVHQGRTPPCVEAIVRAGIRRVVVGEVDTNPCVAGRGIEHLRAEGIQVDVGCASDVAHALNVVFHYHITQQKPFVVAKWAMSLDGKMIAAPSDAPVISSPASQKEAHYWRQYCDAILIGVETLIQDDPLLTARYLLDDLEVAHPLRVILDPQGRSPLLASALAAETPGKTLLVSGPDASPRWVRHIKKTGHDVLMMLAKLASTPDTTLVTTC